MSTILIKFLYIMIKNEAVMIRLYELRTDRELSQRAIAAQMNISQATYNNWENSKTQPSIEQLITLANFFEVTVDYLIGREEGGFPKKAVADGLICEYRQLSDEDKNTVNSLIRRLKNS